MIIRFTLWKINFKSAFYIIIWRYWIQNENTFSSLKSASTIPHWKGAKNIWPKPVQILWLHCERFSAVKGWFSSCDLEHHFRYTRRTDIRLPQRRPTEYLFFLCIFTLCSRGTSELKENSIGTQKKSWIKFLLFFFNNFTLTFTSAKNNFTLNFSSLKQ